MIMIMGKHGVGPSFGSCTVKKSDSSTARHESLRRRILCESRKSTAVRRSDSAGCLPARQQKRTASIVFVSLYPVLHGSRGPVGEFEPPPPVLVACVHSRQPLKTSPREFGCGFIVLLFWDDYRSTVADTQPLTALVPSGCLAGAPSTGPTHSHVSPALDFAIQHPLVQKTRRPYSRAQSRRPQSPFRRRILGDGTRQTYGRADRARETKRGIYPPLFLFRVVFPGNLLPTEIAIVDLTSENLLPTALKIGCSLLRVDRVSVATRRLGTGSAGQGGEGARS
jgi:hypothetical protein